MNALAFYNEILDTININSSSYNSLLMTKGVTQIIVGQDVQGKKTLQDLYIKQKEGPFKEMIFTVMNQTKDELLNNEALR